MLGAGKIDAATVQIKAWSTFRFQLFQRKYPIRSRVGSRSVLWQEEVQLIQRVSPALSPRQITPRCLQSLEARRHPSEQYRSKPRLREFEQPTGELLAYFAQRANHASLRLQHPQPGVAQQLRLGRIENWQKPNEARPSKTKKGHGRQ
jgi:hypothetical protein